jgi:heavy metal translocating P-type ATPase
MKTEPSSRGAAACKLCGLPLRGSPDEQGAFCCRGCARVYDVLQGLDESAAAVYVEAARRMGIIPGATTPAVEEEPPLPEDPAALKEERFQVEGMSCPSCAWVLQQVLLSDPGVTDAEADFFTASARVRYDLRRTSVPTLRGILKPLGYGLTAPDAGSGSRVSRGITFDFIVCGVLTMNMMSLAAVRYFELLETYERAPALLAWLELLLLLPVLWLGWIPTVRRAVVGLRGGRMKMDFLIAVGVGAAFILSLAALSVGSSHIYFETCAGLVTISLLSRMIEARLRRRAFADIATLMRMRVVHVRKLGDDGAESYCREEQLIPGDRVRFVAGDTVAVDGTLVGDDALVSEAVLTGEPRPLRKVSGDPIIAGSSVMEGDLVVEVRRPFRETTLFGIVEGIGDSLRKSESRLRSADRIAQWFSPLVMTFALAAWIVRLALHGWEYAISAPGWFPSVAVLAIACPCAFSLAGTAAITAATGGLLRRGILVREPAQLERLHRTGLIVFDKTGTITDGNMSVEALAWRDEPRSDLLSLVLAAEQGSVHPIAQALRAYLSRRDLPPPPSGFEIEDLPGQGRVVRGADRALRIGAASLFDSPFEPPKVTPRHTAVWFGTGRQAAGCFLITDGIKEDARDVARGLGEMGYELEILSGDRQEVCDWVARETGIGGVRGGVSLEEKVEHVRARHATGVEVAFVGDGTNDALAMSEACTSVALARSTDEALAASGFVMRHGRLTCLLDLFAVGRKLRRVIALNYLWAFGFNAVFIPVAAAGKLLPLVAMLLMLSSSAGVLLNSLRMRQRGA